MADNDRTALMDKIVALCKRKGFIFQNSEIYGGQNGFWDYGPLGVELKRNVREAWWQDMVNMHDPLDAPSGAPTAFQMVGVDTSIIMHPQVWKCSGHYDQFVDKMVDCKQCKGRFRADHLRFKLAVDGSGEPLAAWGYMPGSDEFDWPGSGDKKLKKAAGDGASDDIRDTDLAGLTQSAPSVTPHCPNPACRGELTEPRDFNLMFKTIVGALGTEDDAAFLRPETAQGIFVNFKNVVDSSRVKIPFGVAQIGKSFRNEITPRNFTFRSREFEQMEIEFFCHPDSSQHWYQYWRDRRFAWYTSLGIGSERLTLRDHDADELSHYSVGTADIEYQFPFMAEGEFGELEGIAHRGDYDLRSHMEGKLQAKDGQLELQLDEHGQPKWRGSGKDLTYFDDQAQGTLHAARHRTLRRCGPGDAGVHLRGVLRRRTAGRQGQHAVPHGDAVPSPAGPHQSRRPAAHQEGGHAGEGEGTLPRSQVSRHRRPVRRTIRHRPSLPPPGRNRHPLVHHHRRPDGRRRRHGHPPRPRLTGTGAVADGRGG